MILLYFLFCYITALTDQVDSYVLLAANLEDFRSIARKFLPAKLADHIVEMATNERNNEDQDYSQEIELTQEPTFEVQTEAIKKSMPRYNLKQSAQGLTIDEIVDKVREKLQSELAQTPNKKVRLTSGNGGNPVVHEYDYRQPDNVEEPMYEDPTYDVVTERPPPRIQQQRLGPKKIVRNQNFPKQGRFADKPRLVGQHRPISGNIGRINQGRIVQKPMKPAKTIPTLKPNYLKLKPRGHQLVAKPDAHLIIGNKKALRKPQLIVRTTRTTQAITETTTEEPMVFEAVDMLKSNDSYEDYVTPAREEPYASDEEITTTPGKLIITFKPKPIIITTEPQAAVEEPLEEEVIKEPEIYDDEPTESTTPAELKARTESLSYEEKETKVDPNVTTTTEVTVKGKGKPKMKIGTMIPTRERFKLSSPNYYAKLPTIAETYKFNEPIPEQDRVPENLNPIGAPPSNVNGKVMLMT